jgi:hypothetical protein
MIVEAQCLEKAFDNQTGRSFFPGFVQDYDTENRQLNSLTTSGGKWIFQYPGHQGGPGKEIVPDPVKIKAKAEPKPDKRRQKMSPERIRQMMEGRARKRAEREARILAAV